MEKSIDYKYIKEIIYGFNNDYKKLVEYFKEYEINNFKDTFINPYDYFIGNFVNNLIINLNIEIDQMYYILMRTTDQLEIISKFIYRKFVKHMETDLDNLDYDGGLIYTLNGYKYKFFNDLQSTSHNISVRKRKVDSNNIEYTFLYDIYNNYVHNNSNVIDYIDPLRQKNIMTVDSNKAKKLFDSIDSENITQDNALLLYIEHDEIAKENIKVAFMNYKIKLLSICILHEKNNNEFYKLNNNIAEGIIHYKDYLNKYNICIDFKTYDEYCFKDNYVYLYSKNDNNENNFIRLLTLDELKMLNQMFQKIDNYAIDILAIYN